MIKKYLLDKAGNGQLFTCNKIIYEKKSKFQKIQIADLELLGRVLVLDDIIQLSELDCDVYHESFAHIPISFIPKPSRVLILGGGDGILAKELLKYEDIKIDLVDIDSDVCIASKKFLVNCNKNSLDDESVSVYNLDAIDFCEKIEKDTYDAIFGDITDPHPDSPSSSLLSEKSLCTYKRILKKTGVLAIQTDNVQVAPDHVLTVSKKLKKQFSCVENFSIVALTLGGLFSFSIAKNSDQHRKKISVKTNWLDEEKVKINFLLHNYHS